MTVKTRFAPSPTGFLHVGGARTALYSWLYARRHAGQFVLRIEDTDLERSTPESVQAILDGMEWLGLDYDEGPYYQTQRMDHYQACLNDLLASDKAYRCYCSKERLEQLRTDQMEAKQKPRYDGHCRDLNLPARAEPFVVRFRNPLEGTVDFTDQVYGKISIQNSELDDLILARSDGMPTYNFTVVVDDAEMAITHVIRGDDHINNTPRQINILKAIGASVPIYAHLPMILGDDGKRLSKRHGAVSVMQYRDDGYLPEALLNYLVRLGWSNGDQEIFSVDDMMATFDLTNISKGASAFNTEKLQWLNQHYMKSLPAETVGKYLEWHLKHQKINYLFSDIKLPELVSAMAERSKTLVEMVEKSQYFFDDEIEIDPLAAKQHLTEEILRPLQWLYGKLESLPWEESLMHPLIVEAGTHFDMKMGKIAQPLRVAVTGNTMSPSIDKTLYLLGKNRVLKRLKLAIEKIQGGSVVTEHHDRPSL